MRTVLFALVLAGYDCAAHAQDWATADVCRVKTAEITETAFAPATFDALEAAGANLANGKGRFWRIETSNGAVSHLWGTMHSADPLILDLPQALRSVIGAARVVGVEIDFAGKSRAGLRASNNLMTWFSV